MKMYYKHYSKLCGKYCLLVNNYKYGNSAIVNNYKYGNSASLSVEAPYKKNLKLDEISDW
jgi:hypothetical protein